MKRVNPLTYFLKRFPAGIVVISILSACMLGLLFAFVEPKIKAEPTAMLIIKISPVFNGRPLVLNKDSYVTENGDTLTVAEFKCYLSSLSLQSASAGVYVDPTTYHLIDAEDSLSCILTAAPGAGSYASLTFNIGVDSATCISGSLAGALDPVYGMYWAWNTGYVHAKLTGYSKKCKTLHHAFDFHIGGYLSPCNALRTVQLPCTNLHLDAGKQTVIELHAELAEWFKTPSLINLAQTNSIVVPGGQAMMMADNYNDMFSVYKIH